MLTYMDACLIWCMGPHYPNPSGKRCPPHLRVPVLMPLVDRHFQAELHRGMLKVGVALLPRAGKTIVKGLSGTTCAEFRPSKHYQTKAGKPATSLTSAEYLDFIKEVLSQLKPHRESIIWVHDRDPSHRTHAVTQYLESQGHKVMLLPPRSPDLDPLDYAVFGHAKAWLERTMPSSMSSWEQRCSAFVKHLQGISPQKQVEHYIQRLELVLEENGGHIEERMRRSK